MTPRHRSPGELALSRCVPNPQEFLDEVWTHQPVYYPGMDDGGFADLLSINDIDRLLMSSGLRYPAVNVILAGKRLPSTTFTRAGNVGSVRLDDIIDGSKVTNYYRQGATVVLSSAHRYWPPLRRFARDLESLLTHPVQTNIYLTPPDARGLNLHWDTHDVFVLQCHGDKYWEVFGEGFRLPLRHQHRKAELESVGQPLVAKSIQAGDAIYIPRGFVHAAETRAVASAHITVGILSYTWADTLLPALVALERQVEFREAVPAGFVYQSRSTLAAEIATRLDQLATLIAAVEPGALADSLLNRFARSRVRDAEGWLQDVVNATAINDDTIVVRRQDGMDRIDTTGGKIIVTAGLRQIILPARTRRPVIELLSGNNVPVGRLAPYLDKSGRNVLVRRFLSEGLIRLVSEAP